MVNKELRKHLQEYCGNNLLFFDNPSFDNSIIGVEEAETGDYVVCYSFQGMVQELAQDDEITIDDAIEFIEYNTIRALSYYENHPRIIFTDLV